jgi:hypothetical protein
VLQRDIIFADIFAHFVEPQLREERDGWDNYSPDEQWNGIDMSSNLTYEDCKRTCEEDGDCLQFAFRTGSCKTSVYIRAGWKVPDGEKNIKSGWLLDRTKAIREKVCVR